MISIIMPLYNAEAFLEEAIKSIRNQSYKDFELLCINDASEDSTVSIVEDAMLQDERIKLFHNDIRSGAAVSRNKGLKHAKGEYVTFLDGDDVFEEEMLEKAYSLAKEKELDVVIYELLHVASEKIYEKRTINRDESYKRKYCSKPFCILDLEPEDCIPWSNGPCNKLFKKEFIDKNGLEFQILNSSNDVYFVEMSFMLAERMMFLDDERVMVYARDHFTPTRISYDRDPMCTYYACMKMLEEMLLRGGAGARGEYLYLKCYFILLNGISKAKTEEKKVSFYEFLRTEGIKNLREIDRKSYESLSQYIKDDLERFEKKDYSTRWFEEESMISFLIRRREDNILKLFEKGKHVVIWGAGHYGKNVIKYIENKDMEIQAVVDTNCKKHGMKIGQYIVVNLEEVDFRNTDVVIVAARNIYREVEAQLQHYNLQVVDLLTQLEFGKW